MDVRIQVEEDGAFRIDGAWVDFRDFEVTNSGRKRTTSITGSWPLDIQRGGIDCRGSEIRFINLVVHDTNEGFGFWADGAGGEIYGCVIYHNGWNAPDRGHGHAIYTQNRTGIKTLQDNVLFEQFGYGIHAYGSPKASLRAFRIVGNVAFNNGAPSSPEHLTPGLFVGGENPASDVALLDNLTYGVRGGSVLLGYPWGPANDDVILRGNTIVGPLSFLKWRSISSERNTVVNGDLLAGIENPPGGRTRYQAGHNRYFQLSAGDAFEIDSSPAGWTEWRQGETAERLSELTPGRPRGEWITVRPNRYERGRANIIIFNWDHRDRVAVDLRAVLKSGQRYQIVWAQDFFGRPVVAGKYDGRPVSIPMSPRRAEPVVGLPDYTPPPTLPEFGVFVVLPIHP